jgi:hypothetical protein
MVEGLREGFWWKVQPGLEGKKFPNAKMTAEQMEFVDKVWEEWKAQGVLKWDSEVCVWDEGSKEKGAQEVEIVHQQQTGEQKGAQIKSKVRGYRGGEKVDEDVWVGALV